MTIWLNIQEGVSATHKQDTQIQNVLQSAIAMMFAWLHSQFRKQSDFFLKKSLSFLPSKLPNTSHAKSYLILVSFSCS
jgi:hypothetical protein